MRTVLVFFWLSVAWALPCGPAWCADAGPLSIAVPQGFDGPTRRDENGGMTIAWIKHRPASDGGTLLQVSAIDVGTSFDGATRMQRGQVATHYLKEFAKGLAGRLGDFALGDIDAVSIAGLPGTRARWTGTVGGKPSIGVMYCVLVGHSIVSLQTQDLGSEITPAMYSAIGAIERARVR